MALPPNLVGHFQKLNRSTENEEKKQTHLTFALVKQVTIAMDSPAADAFEDLTNNREESTCDDNSNRLKTTSQTQPPFSSGLRQRPELHFGLSKVRSQVKISLPKRKVSPSKKKTRFATRAESCGPPSMPRVDKLPGVCTANKILYYFLSTLRENEENVETENPADYQEDNEQSEFGYSQCSEDGSVVDAVTEYSDNPVPKTSNGGTFVVVDGNHKRYKTAAQLREADVDVFDPAYNDPVNETCFSRQKDIGQGLKFKHIPRLDKRPATKRNTNCSKEKQNRFAFDDEIFKLIHSEAQREALCPSDVETESEDEETQYITPGNTLNRILKMISQHHENVQVKDMDDVSNEADDRTLRNNTSQRSRFRRSTHSVDGRSDSKRNERNFRFPNSPDFKTRQPSSKNDEESDSENTAKTCVNKLNRELFGSDSEDQDGLIRAKKLNMLETMIDTMCSLNGEEFLLMDVTSHPEQSRDRTDMTSYPEQSRDPFNMTSHPELKRHRTSASRVNKTCCDTPQIHLSKRRSRDSPLCPDMSLWNDDHK